jgi:hypothetical protein
VRWARRAGPPQGQSPARGAPDAVPRSDAEQTVAAFAASLKDALDLDSVRENLAGIVQQTPEPTHVSVWIRRQEAARSRCSHRTQAMTRTERPEDRSTHRPCRA